MTSRRDRAAIHPIDPLGGGTWIAMSAAGLTFALLNGSDGDSPPRAMPATIEIARQRR
jgi:hypothetical protein